MLLELENEIPFVSSSLSWKAAKKNKKISVQFVLNSPLFYGVVI